MQKNSLPLVSQRALSCPPILLMKYPKTKDLFRCKPVILKLLNNQGNGVIESMNLFIFDYLYVFFFFVLIVKYDYKTFEWGRKQ